LPSGEKATWWKRNTSPAARLPRRGGAAVPGRRPGRAWWFRRGGGGMPFAHPASRSPATSLHRRAEGDAVQPARHRLPLANRAGLAPQDEEHRLEGVLGVLLLPEHKEADGPDTRPVPGHQFGKGPWSSWDTKRSRSCRSVWSRGARASLVPSGSIIIAVMVEALGPFVGDYFPMVPASAPISLSIFLCRCQARRHCMAVIPYTDIQPRTSQAIPIQGGLPSDAPLHSCALTTFRLASLVHPTSRTFCARPVGVNGFCRKLTSS
jgi:hypothetical protein